MPGLRIPLIFAAMSCAALLPACAAQAPGGAAVADAGAGDLICRDVLEPPSNVPRRMCATEAEWRDYNRARERDAQEFMRRMDTLSTMTQP